MITGKSILRILVRVRRRSLRVSISLLLLGGAAEYLRAEQALTWEAVRQKFEATNPTLKANQALIDESRADEITAYLRPNPDLNVNFDQINPFSTQPPPTGGPNIYSPFAYALPSGSFDYLHERRHKRELRLQTAKESTAVTQSTYFDQERSLLFTLRNAFVEVLQEKAVLGSAKEDLAYWDRELGVNLKRVQAGDMAQVDYDRLVLQRAQFESDFETAIISLRTAKIQLLQLLNERTPIEEFDVTGPFEFNNELLPLEKFQQEALANRPDLRAAVQSVELAVTTHKLSVSNGSTDPTFSVDFGRNPPIPAYMGVSVSIPLRIFDRNQGDKAHTLIDIGRSEQSRDAAKAQVYNDVDSAYVTLVGTVNLLKPYKSKYMDLATRIRDRISFAYQHGGASLLDYLDAEAAYRATRLAYLNLIGSYLTAAAQMDMAVGREIME